MVERRKAMDISVENALLGVCYYLDQNGCTSIPFEKVDDFLSLLEKKMRFVDIYSSKKELKDTLYKTEYVSVQSDNIMFHVENWWYTNRYTFTQNMLEFFNSTAEAYSADYP